MYIYIYVDIHIIYVYPHVAVVAFLCLPAKETAISQQPTSPASRHPSSSPSTKTWGCGPSQAVPPTLPNHWSALAPKEAIYLGVWSHVFPENPMVYHLDPCHFAHLDCQRLIWLEISSVLYIKLEPQSKYFNMIQCGSIARNWSPLWSSPNTARSPIFTDT